MCSNLLVLATRRAAAFSTVCWASVMYRFRYCDIWELSVGRVESFIIEAIRESSVRTARVTTCYSETNAFREICRIPWVMPRQVWNVIDSLQHGDFHTSVIGHNHTHVLWELSGNPACVSTGFAESSRKIHGTEADRQSGPKISLLYGGCNFN